MKALLKKKIKVFIILMILSSVAYANDEISLFDSSGKPIAYIVENMTIYLWSGKPVAYLYESSGKLHLYGFNGKHLGWFSKGIVYDHEGDAVGAVKEVFSSPVEPEPYKSYKEFKPFKSFREFAPFRPFLSNNWSDIPLQIFLLQGVS